MEFNEFGYYRKLNQSSVDDLRKEMEELSSERKTVRGKVGLLISNLEADEAGNITYADSLRTSMENDLESKVEELEIIDMKISVLYMFVNRKQGIYARY